MIKVIVLKNSNLGKIGDIINVKSGYARNYLIPYKKVLIANKNNINKFSKKKYNFDFLKDKKNKFFSNLYKKINLLSPLKLYYRCTKNGKLFDSLKCIDIYRILLKRIKLKFSKKIIFLPKGPIKYLGEHTINIKIYKKDILYFKINLVSIK